MTEKQLKLLRYLIYNYKIIISEENVTTVKDTSVTLSKIQTAISKGTVVKRTSRPYNSKVKLIDGQWRLAGESFDEYNQRLNAKAL